MAAFEPNRLRGAAEAKLYSLPGLARELGVAEKTVYRWNAGRVPPRIDNVRRLTELLDCDASVFYESQEQAA